MRFAYILMIALSSLGVGCQAQSSVTKRFFVHAVIRVGDETFKGSSVWQATVEDGPDILFQTGPVNAVSAEAIRVPILGDHAIFVLPRRAYPPDNYAGRTSFDYGAFVRNCILLDVSDPHWMASLSDFTGSCSIDEKPVLVLFSDPADPNSMTIIKYGPNETIDLLDISVTITDQPLSSDTADYLPWLDGLPPDANIRTGMPDGKTGDFFVGSEFYARDFIKGGKELTTLHSVRRLLHSKRDTWRHIFDARDLGG